MYGTYFIILIISCILLFSGCITDQLSRTDYDVVLVNDSDFDIEDYASFGPIKSGEHITIFGHTTIKAEAQTAKNCCRRPYFFQAKFYTRNNPDSFGPPPPSNSTRYSKADIRFDKSHCIYFKVNKEHYDIANYEIMDVGRARVQLTYRVTNEVFLQVEACRPIRLL